MEQEPIQQPPPGHYRPTLTPRPSRARWIIPLVLLFLAMGFVAIVGALFVVGSAMRAQGVSKGTILELSLMGSVRESPDPLGELLPGLAGPPSLFEIRQALIRAAADADIAGVKVDVQAAGFGFAIAEELTAAFTTFRASGKPLHVFLRGDLVSDLDYAVSLAATKIWLAPEAAVFINGLRAEVEFWRGTLDKLHIEPQYFMMKEYKSAGEIFSRHEMSEHFREATTALIEDIWETFLADVAARRKLPLDKVRALADLGVMTPAQARDEGWVDALGYDEDVRAELAAADDYHAVSLRTYLESSKEPKADARIALVFGEGPIVATGGASLFGDQTLHGPRVAAALRKAADDDGVKAILFRVDSPGGSAVGSDHVWRAVQYAQEHGKPVIVSMGNAAASGGYWVSMRADAIIARPTTITGSIGVVFGKLNVRGLYEMAGANIDTVQVGANADLLSAVSSLDGEQTKTIQGWMEAIYGDFVGKVAAGRGLDLERVGEIARGRVWSGVDALDNGLIDQLGGYDEAIAAARTEAGIDAGTAVELVVYPKPQNFLELLFADDGVTHLRALTQTRDPIELLHAAIGELAKPGAWVIAPNLRID